MKYRTITLAEADATVIHGPAAVSLARNGKVELVVQDSPDELLSAVQASEIAKRLIDKRKVIYRRHYRGA